MSAIQMAKPPDPGVPHPSLQLCDLFFLAGDLDTLHSLAEVRESRNQYSLSLSSSHLTSLSLSLALSLMSIFSLSFQLCPSALFASGEEEAM